MRILANLLLRPVDNPGFAALHKLMRVEDDTILCGGCHRRWRKPEILNEANLRYLNEHASDHPSHHAHGPRSRRSSAYTTPWSGEAVECQSCGTWFNTRRCQKCFPDFAWRRSQPPPAG